MDEKRRQKEKTSSHRRKIKEDEINEMSFAWVVEWVDESELKLDEDRWRWLPLRWWVTPVGRMLCCLHSDDAPTESRLQSEEPRLRPDCRCQMTHGGSHWPLGGWDPLLATPYLVMYTPNFIKFHSFWPWIITPVSANRFVSKYSTLNLPRLIKKKKKIRQTKKLVYHPMNWS